MGSLDQYEGRCLLYYANTVYFPSMLHLEYSQGSSPQFYFLSNDLCYSSLLAYPTFFCCWNNLLHRFHADYWLFALGENFSLLVCYYFQDN